MTTCLSKARPYALALLVALLPLASVGSASAGEDCYLLMFGSQRTPTEPNYTHTWATFVRLSWPGDGPCPVNVALQEATISWLPANGQVRVCSLLPEPGRNHSPAETLRWCYQNDMRVSLWGAYRIQPELFWLALKQKALLESGQVCYQPIDIGRSSDQVSNCIHAVSSTIEGPRLRVFVPGWGETASYLILRKFMPYVIDPNQVHPGIGSALGLDQYPIIYRDYQNPMSGGILGPANRLFGGEKDLRATYGPPVR